MTARTPPRVATWLLERLGGEIRFAPVIGDLIEQFDAGRSSYWYWWQASGVLALELGRVLRAHALSFSAAILAGFALTQLWELASSHLYQPLYAYLPQLERPSLEHGFLLEHGRHATERPVQLRTDFRDGLGGHTRPPCASTLGAGGLRARVLGAALAGAVPSAHGRGDSLTPVTGAGAADHAAGIAGGRNTCRGSVADKGPTLRRHGSLDAYRHRRGGSPGGYWSPISTARAWWARCPLSRPEWYALDLMDVAGVAYLAILLWRAVPAAMNRTEAI